ncbi:MAG: hypothetical protein DRR42_19840 [Gammaproteobacteria bacterium]|nr:MAG: hypothetical protein DRR42_19840 [Gammaproteobacteria bacterium]
MTNSLKFPGGKMINRLLIGLVIPLSTVVVQLAHAGGLWINEYGSPTMGRAGAGAEAGTGDASAAFHNPASMAQIKSKQLMVTGGVVSATSKFSVDSYGTLNGNNNGGDAGQDAAMASFFYVNPINDQWQVGLSFGGLTGAELDYGSGWTGRYQAKSVELVGIAVMPSVAYNISDKLSIGFGLPIMYTELELKVAVPRPEGSDGEAKIDGDDTVVGYHLSLWYELSEATQFGMFYQSNFDAEYDGNVKIKPADLKVASDTSLDFAAKARAGLTHQFTDEFSGHITLGWDDWSSLGNINISTSTGTSVDTPRHWEDTYHYAVGMSYQLTPVWILNAGYAYDTNPVSKEDRTADLPVDRQNRYAIGIEHKSPNSFDWGAHLVYADLGSSKIDAASVKGGPLTGFSGKYRDNEVIFASFSANWTF